MRMLMMGVLLAATGCADRVGSASAPASSEAKPPLAVAEVPSIPAGPVATFSPAPPSPCGVIPAPPAPLAEAEGGACATLGPAHRWAEQQLRKGYTLTNTGARLKVGFECDGLHEPVDRIRFARGWGHGHNLFLYEFVREGAQFELRGVAYEVATEAQPPKLVSATVDAAKVEAALERVRALLGARLEEVLPPPKPGTIAMRSIGSSSSNVHVAIGLQAGGLERRWRFTGYQGTPHQDVHLPLRLAGNELGALLNDVEPELREVTAADRAHFADHFHHEAPHFDDKFNGWVKARYVAIARHLGSRSLIPGLVKRLKVGERRSTKGTTDDALAALADITGWDAVAEASGEGEGDGRGAAIAAYRRHCGGP